jgi:hypothetical protein
MNYFKRALWIADDLLDCVKAAWRGAVYEWKFRSHMRRGGNPDSLPF